MSGGEASEEHVAELPPQDSWSALPVVQSEDNIQAEAILMQDVDIGLSSVDGDIDMLANGGSHDATVPVKPDLSVSMLH